MGRWKRQRGFAQAWLLLLSVAVSLWAKDITRSKVIEQIVVLPQKICFVIAAIGIPVFESSMKPYEHGISLNPFDLLRIKIPTSSVHGDNLYWFRFIARSNNFIDSQSRPLCLRDRRNDAIYNGANVQRVNNGRLNPVVSKSYFEYWRTYSYGVGIKQGRHLPELPQGGLFELNKHQWALSYFQCFVCDFGCGIGRISAFRSDVILPGALNALVRYLPPSLSQGAFHNRSLLSISSPLQNAYAQSTKSKESDRVISTRWAIPRPLLFFGGLILLLCGVLLAANSRSHIAVAVGILMCAIAAFGPLMLWP